MLSSDRPDCGSPLRRRLNGDAFDHLLEQAADLFHLAVMLCARLSLIPSAIPWRSYRALLWRFHAVIWAAAILSSVLNAVEGGLFCRFALFNLMFSCR